MSNGYERMKRALDRRKSKAMGLLRDHNLLRVESDGVNGFGVCEGGRVRIDALHALEREGKVIRVRDGFSLRIVQSTTGA